MRMSSFCSLKLLPLTPPLDPPPSSSSSLPTKANLDPRKCDTRSSRRTNHMVGLACSMIISVEMGDVMSNITHVGGHSMASELAIESQMILPNNNDKNLKVAKWSEKRICPPWHFNSLETIVPEKLPRPSSHRKWEWVSNSSQLAPSLKSTSLKSRSTICFSL